MANLKNLCSLPALLVMAAGCGDDAPTSPPDTTPPILSDGQPRGTFPRGTSSATLRVTTNEAATCKWSAAPGIAYAAMPSTFETTGTTSHSAPVTGLSDGGAYSYYVRCQDLVGNANGADYLIDFRVGSEPGPLALSLVASRTSGVAPLSVFFDASGTTDTAVTSRPFHDLEYRWNFGDPAGGATWASGAQPGVIAKNLATGPVAAHVFETPGMYIVTLSVFDGTNTQIVEAGVTVDDPDVVFAGTATVCVAATGLPVPGAGGCPAGANVVQQPDFAAAVNAYALSGTRVLFNRGDTFVAPTAAVLTNTGPGVLGAFGAGARPRVQMTGDTTFVMLSSRDTPTIRDWRIMGLEFDGLGHTSSVGINTDGGIDQVLVLDMNMHDIADGIVFNRSILEYWFSTGRTMHSMFDEIAIVDNTVVPIVGSTTGWRIFASAEHFSIQGNTLGNTATNDSMGSHVVRIPYMGKGVIANNVIARAAAVQPALKMHGPTWCDATSPAGMCLTPSTNPPATADYGYLTNTPPLGIFAATSGYTEKVVISDNEFIGADNPWTVGLGPQNAQTDERVRDVIVERNWFTSGAATQVPLVVWSVGTTIRNNVCDLTGTGGRCVAVTPRGVEPPPTNVHIVNNTFYCGSANDLVGVSIDAAASNVTVANNLGSAPSATYREMVAGTGVFGLIESNNLLHDVPAELFVTATPVAPSDFNLRALPNPARDTGLSTVPVFSDFFLVDRPQNGAIDIGAVEGP